MTFDVQVSHHVTEIGQAQWDRLAGGRPFASYRWYRFGEAALEDCLPYYITLSEAGEPVARGTFWLKRREWLPVTSRLARAGAEILLQRWPLLSCETPLASLSGLILPETPSRRAAALETIFSHALELAKKEQASFALAGYINAEEARQPGWPEAYSAISYADAETRLDIAWPDFESYLKSLAKSTRRNYRLHCKQAAALGIMVTSHTEISNVDEVQALVGNVERHHRVGHRPWTRGVLENSSLVDSTWIAARVGERLVGCCSLVGDGRFQIATLLGLDYSFPQHIQVYYQVIYAAISCAIEQQAQVLFGGGGAYELKRRLGFQKLADDYLMLAATGRSSRWLVRGMLRWTGMQAKSSNNEEPNEPEDPDREENGQHGI